MNYPLLPWDASLKDKKEKKEANKKKKKKKKKKPDMFLISEVLAFFPQWFCQCVFGVSGSYSILEVQFITEANISDVQNFNFLF